MRFILLAPFACPEADRDAALIDLMGEHTTSTLYALADADHPHNHGRVPTDAELRQVVALEIIGGAVPVLHPELKGAELNRVLHLCTYLEVAVVELPELMTLLFKHTYLTQEHIDSLNVLDHLASRHAGQADPRRTMVPAEGVPAALPKAAMATVSTTKGTRTLGDRLRELQARVLRWEQRANAVLGPMLKNPASRPYQAPVRPYRLHTAPPTTTG